MLSCRISLQTRVRRTHRYMHGAGRYGLQCLHDLLTS